MSERHERRGHAASVADEETAYALARLAHGHCPRHVDCDRRDHAGCERCADCVSASVAYCAGAGCPVVVCATPAEWHAARAPKLKRAKETS